MKHRLILNLPFSSLCLLGAGITLSFRIQNTFSKPHAFNPYCVSLLPLTPFFRERAICEFEEGEQGYITYCLENREMHTQREERARER